MEEELGRCKTGLLKSHSRWRKGLGGKALKEI